MQETTTLGAGFAHAVAAKDAGALRELMHPQIDFRGITPDRFWEAADPDAVLEILFGEWFEDKDEIRSVEHVERDGFADRERVGYRFSIENPDGHFLIEQQAFLTQSDGRIEWMRVLCSGFRPVE